MRCITTLLLLFSVVRLTAQPQFEGKVNYTATSPEKQGNGKLTIFFSKPGIRLEVSEEGKTDKEPETLIFNFDSGKIFTLMPNEKKYKESILKRQPPASMTAGKKIAGFTTEVVRTEFTGMSKDIIDIFGSSVLYASTDLHYTIPPLYSRNPQLLMVNGGKIVLGGDFFLPDYPYADSENGKDTASGNQLLFTVRADQVIPQKLEASLFTVPDGFEKWSYTYEYDSTMVDSTAMYLDSAAAAPQKPTTKKNKKTPSKKKATTKQSATRRKGD